MDDEALLLTATSPQHLVGAVPKVIAAVHETFSSLGLRINWDPGKTEAFLVLRGKGAVQLRQKVFGADPPGIDVDLVCGTSRLRLVHTYKHLGSMLSDNGTCDAEAGRRSKSALNAYAPIAVRVLGSKCISLRLRTTLAMALVMSRLLYNVHVWSTVTATTYAKLNTVYMRVLRRLSGLHWSGSVAGRVNDLQVRRRLNAPSLESLIRQRRLLYFATLMRSDAHALISMLSVVDNDGSPLLPWARVLFEDLRSLREFHGHKLGELGDPAGDILPWVRLASRYPRPWSELVNAFIVHEAARETKVSAPAVGPQHACHICRTEGSDAAFISMKALQLHMRTKHGVQNALKRFIDGSGACPVCCATFSSRTRLLAHVAEQRRRGRATHTCGMILATGAFPQIDPVTAARCDADDARRRREARREGHSQPLAGHAAAKRTRWRCVPDAHSLMPRRRIRAKASGIELRRAKVRAQLFAADGGPRKRYRVAGKSSAPWVVHKDLLTTARRIASQGPDA